jgi:hypothetical protein
MEHHEFLYLLHRAHILRKFIEKAEREGEEFHVSEHFIPLLNETEAQAQIRKINPTDTDPVLILRVRYPVSLPDGDVKALKAADAFFSGKFTAVPGTIRQFGRVEHIFYSPDILRPVTLDDQ